jgi:hypothetical protein
MPITFTPLGPSPAAIGWGMFFDITSDFIGPFPTGTVWFIKYTADAEGANIVASQTLPATSNTRRIELDVRNGSVTFGNYAIPVGQNVHVITQLIQPGNVVVDSGATAIPWVQSSDDYRALLLQIPAAGTGLTATQSTQLQEAHDALQIPITTSTGVTTIKLSDLLSQAMLDALTLTEVTPGTPQPFAAQDLPNNAVGLIVRVTDLGPGYASMSPDDGWFRPELAVANFFRGTDLVARVGLHTASRFIYPLPGAWSEWASLLFGGTLPPDYSVQVTFAAGNLGRVFFTALP